MHQFSLNGVQEAASSNLATPTKKVLDFTRKIKDFSFFVLWYKTRENSKKCFLQCTAQCTGIRVFF